MPTLAGRGDPEALLQYVAEHATATDQPIKLRIYKQIYDPRVAGYYSDKRRSYVLEFHSAEEVRAFEAAFDAFIGATERMGLPALAAVLEKRR